MVKILFQTGNNHEENGETSKAYYLKLYMFVKLLVCLLMAILFIL